MKTISEQCTELKAASKTGRAKWNLLIIVVFGSLIYFLNSLPGKQQQAESKPAVTTTQVLGNLLININDRKLSNDECAQYISDTVNNYDTSKVTKISVFDTSGQVCFSDLKRDSGIVYIDQLLKR